MSDKSLIKMLSIALVLVSGVAGGQAIGVLSYALGASPLAALTSGGTASFAVAGTGLAVLNHLRD